MSKFAVRPHLALVAAALCGAVALQPGVAGAAPTAAAPARNVAREEANRALVLKFSEAVFNHADFDYARTVLAEDYIQHNPRMGTGREAFIAAYKGVIAAHPGLHSEVLRSAAEGDLVFTHVHVTDGSGHYHIALVNIFRVANGKIVEHWDVVQPVPDAAANANTMY